MSTDLHNVGLSHEDIRRTFDHSWSGIEPLGRDPRTGGYNRFAWTRVDLSLREWFAAESAKRGLSVEVDRNGNQWAWWGEPQPGSVVTGSHLDSVPGGGTFDGPLGIVSAFLAVDALQARDLVPDRSLAIVNFFEEEGARFGLACLGSRLMTGTTDADKARSLKDDSGTTLAEALTGAGLDARFVGTDPVALERIGVFVELHVEQGRQLVLSNDPVGVASSIWPHGRWHFCFSGEGNHAGTTMLEDRHDPMLPFAEVIGAARRIAEDSGAVATFGRVRVDPNGTNAIPSQVDTWLDARAADEGTVTQVIRALEAAGAETAAHHGVGLTVSQESWSPVVDFDASLRDRLLLSLAADGASVPVLPTAAGHDAGILASKVPTAMLFVRNPSGVSHSPHEHAEASDCVDGVVALTTVLADLLTGPLEVVAK
ncbi:N-formylglutamate deformylase [Leifsonia rubra CMS 76R]|nr:N-formylglutamate deformylase [Leifsonia rubra CMS 76R]